MSVGGIESFHSTFNSLLFKSIRVSATETYRSAKSKNATQNDSADKIKTRWLNAVERVFSEHPGQIAGIILEPLIQGAVE